MMSQSVARETSISDGGDVMDEEEEEERFDQYRRSLERQSRHITKPSIQISQTALHVHPRVPSIGGSRVSQHRLNVDVMMGHRTSTQRSLRRHSVSPLLIVSNQAAAAVKSNKIFAKLTELNVSNHQSRRYSLINSIWYLQIYGVRMAASNNA